MRLSEEERAREEAFSEIELLARDMDAAGRRMHNAVAGLASCAARAMDIVPEAKGLLEWTDASVRLIPNSAELIVRLLRAHAQAVMDGDTTKKEGDVEFLDHRLDSLDFGKGSTARARNAFAVYRAYDFDLHDDKAIPLVTVRDLMAMSKAQLLRQPNLGHKTIERVEAVLAAHGLRLAP
jgi:hypothetical protein